MLLYENTELTFLTGLAPPQRGWEQRSRRSPQRRQSAGRSQHSGDEPQELGFSLPPSPPLPTPKQNKGHHLLVPVLVELD